ncbi:hypothetical protein [Kurthia gibsonii]|uniref:hypothetical protein n=1 Tax=Kurthia gibsonii TaxID=33946 RepID=UPI003016FF83
MQMTDIEKTRLLLLKYKEEKKSDLKVSLAYSIIITFTLSKEIFEKNIHIDDFLRINDIHLKDYLFKSRTALIGRLLRIIEKMSIEEIDSIIKNIRKIVFSEVDSIKHSKTSNEKSTNYYDSLLKIFGKNFNND